MEMETVAMSNQDSGLQLEIEDSKLHPSGIPNEASPFIPASLIHQCNPDEVSPEILTCMNALPPLFSVSPEMETVSFEGINIPADFFYKFYTGTLNTEENEAENPPAVLIQKAAEHLSHYVNVPNTDMFTHLCSLYNIFQLDEEVCSFPSMPSSCFPSDLSDCSHYSVSLYGLTGVGTFRSERIRTLLHSNLISTHRHERSSGRSRRYKECRT